MEERMLYIKLDRKDSRPITKQIYQYVKKSILDGILKENEKLPSSRELSKDLSVSRNIVVESYEQLIAEGYLYTKKGAGTYVSEGTVFKVQSLNNYEEEKAEMLEEYGIEELVRTGVTALQRGEKTINNSGDSFDM